MKRVEKKNTSHCKCGYDYTSRMSRNCIFWKFTYFAFTLPSSFSIWSREGKIFFTGNLDIPCPPLLDDVPGRRGEYDVKLSTRDTSLFEISYLSFVLNWEMLGRWRVVQGCSNSSTNQAGISLHYRPVNKSAAVKCGLTWVMADENIVISELESDIFAVCHSIICRGNGH